LKEFGEYAFKQCGIKSIEIPSNVAVIGKGCFFSCDSLCEVIFDSLSKLKAIGDYAFCECEINTVRIPVGFTVQYEWPKNCRIEYYLQVVAAERKK
jgi:hypothetical protein